MVNQNSGHQPQDKNILSELNYLSELLHESTEKTLSLGESVLHSIQNIDTPDRFSTLEEANDFLIKFHRAINPSVSDITAVIANANIDDLGNQSINRIKDLLDNEDQNVGSWVENRLNQSDVDALLLKN
jgi:hypothetical protein